MKRSQSQPSGANLNATKTDGTPYLFASERQFKILVACIAISAALLAGEIAHYVVATDLGATDQMEVNASRDPQCKPLQSKYDFSCPFPGYNSVQMTCMAERCGDRDLSMPPTTDAIRTKTIAMDRADKIASLTIEAPYSGHNADWKQMAETLRSGQDRDPQHGEVHGPPQSLEEAWQVNQQRSLGISRQEAQKWLAQHAR